MNKEILWGEGEYIEKDVSEEEEEKEVVKYVKEELIYFVVQEKITGEWQAQGRKFFESSSKDGRTIWKIRDRETRDLLVKCHSPALLREYHDKLCSFFISQNPFGM